MTVDASYRPVIIPAPGSALHAPCHRCRHEHCEILRHAAAVKCLACLGPLGYDRAFRRAANGFVHLYCPPASAPSEGLDTKDPFQVG